VLQVRRDGLAAQLQLGGDLGVGPPLAEPHQHLGLAGRQPRRQPGPAPHPVTGRLQHRLHRVAVKPAGAHLRAHRPLGVAGPERRAVRTGLAQRIANVGSAEDPRRPRDHLAPQPVRVAGAVEPLVVQRRAVPDLGQQRHPGQHPLGQVRVGPGPLALGDAPFARLVPDAAGNPDHADVVHQRRPAHQDDVGGRQPERRADSGGQLGHPPGVAQAQRRLQVGELGQRAERPVELIIAQHRAQLRVQRDHLLPRRDAAQPVEDLGMPGTEAVDQARVELRAPPLAGHLQRGLRAAGVVERLDAIGQVDQANGRREVIAAGRARYPPPIPSLKGLQQRLAHRGAELQPPGKVARLPAVHLHHPLHRPARGRRELPDHPDPVEPRPTAAEMTGDEDRQGRAVQIRLARVRVQLGLIAEQRRHLTGVHSTAHPRQQRRVIRRHAGSRIHPGRRPQPHGDHGLAQHPLHRAAHPQVRHQRQRRHQLGQADRPRRIRSHRPIIPLRWPVRRS
jgi:hypothetical protein